MERHPAKQREVKRAKRAERRREQTRKEILEVAREIVIRKGFVGFSLSDVAEGLGLTKPALYHYFSSKQELLWELLLNEWVESATAVHGAVKKTVRGVDAVEQIIRTLFDRYRGRRDLFLLGYHRLLAGELGELVGPEELERIRPVNDLLYQGAEARLRADQSTGGFPKNRDPRRFAFTAHMAVIGLLNMKALVESSGDPLIHGDDELIDDLCRTFRDAAIQGAST